MNIGSLLSGVSSTALTVGGQVGGKLLAQALASKTARQFTDIVANEAGSLVNEGLHGLHDALDKWEASHPRVVQAVSAVRSACEGVVTIPTEDQVFNAIEWAVGATLSALHPSQEAS